MDDTSSSRKLLDDLLEVLICLYSYFYPPCHPARSLDPGSAEMVSLTTWSRNRYDAAFWD